MKGISTQEQHSVEFQHVNVKLLLNTPEAVHLDAVIPVFHGWIQEQVFDELLLDVADYRHVHEGPGIVLIGHEADYSLDKTDGRLGIRYNRKAPLEGNNQDRLIQATRAVLNACIRMEQDSRLNGQIAFNGQEIEIFINDRMLAPNLERTREAVAPDLDTLLRKLFGSTTYSLEFTTDPRKLLEARIRASRAFSSSELIQNLAPEGLEL